MGDGYITRRGGGSKRPDEVTSLTIVPNKTDFDSSKWAVSHSNMSVTTSDTSTVIVSNCTKSNNTNYCYIAVDVTGFSKMTIAGSYVSKNSAYSQNGTLNVGLVATPSGSQAVGYAYYPIEDDASHTIPETSYDISSMTGTYYFKVHHSFENVLTDNPQEVTLTLTKVKFE